MQLCPLLQWSLLCLAFFSVELFNSLDRSAKFSLSSSLITVPDGTRARMVDGATTKRA